MNMSVSSELGVGFRVVGLMSGTSLDGIDAALVEFRGAGEVPEWSVLGYHTREYSAEERKQIHDAIVEGSAAALCRLHAQMGEWLASAVLQACEAGGVNPEEVDVVGSHGQTIWHEPPQGGVRGATLQLGCPATIAERTGIAVVSDFRTRDVAAGGEGAPLVPWVDRFLFSHDERQRALQNIGGMGNVTWLPPRGDERAILAFDTGPGVAMIDAAVQIATNGRQAFDREGEWASRGTVDDALMQEVLRHPYFGRKPPKSTGREVFGRPFVQAIADRRGTSSEQEWADLITTLTAVTARTIGDAYRNWLIPLGLDEVFLTGGGARNVELVRRIEAELDPLPVKTGDELGVDPDAKEAVAFAVLAWAFAHGVPGNVPEATGAEGPRVLGSYTPGRKIDRRIFNVTE